MQLSWQCIQWHDCFFHVQPSVCCCPGTRNFSRRGWVEWMVRTLCDFTCINDSRGNDAGLLLSLHLYWNCRFVSSLCWLALGVSETRWHTPHTNTSMHTLSLIVTSLSSFISNVYWIDTAIPLEKFLQLKHYQVQPTTSLWPSRLVSHPINCLH